MRERRGTAAIVVVVLLIVVELIILGMVLGGGRDHALAVRRVEAVQAFYAGEAGMNMAIRELVQEADHDSDGGVGTVSDDSNDATDPAIGVARVVVTKSTSGNQTTVSSVGRSGDSRRRLEAITEAD